MRFRELYEEIISLENALNNLERDIDNASCDYQTKCILQSELERLSLQRFEIMNSDITFKDVNLTKIRNEIERCMSCIDF